MSDDIRKNDKQTMYGIFELRFGNGEVRIWDASITTKIGDPRLLLRIGDHFFGATIDDGPMRLKPFGKVSQFCNETTNTNRHWKKATFVLRGEIGRCGENSSQSDVPAPTVSQEEKAEQPRKTYPLVMRRSIADLKLSQHGLKKPDDWTDDHYRAFLDVTWDFLDANSLAPAPTVSPQHDPSP